MRLLSTLSIVLTVVILSTLPSTTSAVATQATSADHHVAPHERRIDFEFPGGTLPEFVNAIRDKVDGLNVVLSPNAVEVHMPQMSVHNTRVQTLLEMIQHVSISDSYYANAMRADDVFYISASRPRQIQRGVGVPGTGEPSVQTHVFAIGHLIHETFLPKDQILRGIEVVLETDDGDDQPSLRFHEGTNLLIVRGTENHLRMVEQTIGELRESVKVQRQREEYISVRDHDLIIAQCEARYEHLRREAEELRQAVRQHQNQ